MGVTSLNNTEVNGVPRHVLDLRPLAREDSSNQEKLHSPRREERATDSSEDECYQEGGYVIMLLIFVVIIFLSLSFSEIFSDYLLLSVYVFMFCLDFVLINVVYIKGPCGL